MGGTPGPAGFSSHGRISGRSSEDLHAPAEVDACDVDQGHDRPTLLPLRNFPTPPNSNSEATTSPSGPSCNRSEVHRPAGMIVRALLANRSPQPQLSLSAPSPNAGFVTRTGQLDVGDSSRRAFTSTADLLATSGHYLVATHELTITSTVDRHLQVVWMDDQGARSAERLPAAGGRGHLQIDCSVRCDRLPTASRAGSLCALQAWGGCAHQERATR